MKSIILSLAIYSIIIIANSQNVIPNADFESWTQHSNYDSPNFWSNPNSTTASLNIFPVTKESVIKHSGLHSVKIQSKSIFGTPIPGLITLGDFSVNIVTMQATISGGIEFTARPNSLKGYFQYEPVSNDEAFIGILMLKKTGNIWDTIGTGQFRNSTRIVNWTEFSADITYTSTENPTHMNIIIVSSDINLPQPNSTLYIDNLRLTYPMSIDETNNNDIKIFYSNDNLNIINPKSHNIDIIEIYNLEGKLIFNQNINSFSENININVSGLKKGIYLIKYQTNSLNTFSIKIPIL